MSRDGMSRSRGSKLEDKKGGARPGAEAEAEAEARRERREEEEEAASNIASQLLSSSAGGEGGGGRGMEWHAQGETLASQTRPDIPFVS